MAWSEIDLDKRTWTIPGRRVKNDRAHVVHLSEPAIAVLRGLPRISDANGTGGLVFTTTGHTPVSGFSRAKRQIDAAMVNVKRIELRGHRNNRGNGQVEPIVEWTLHDLRRTAATGMARMKVPPHVVDKLLNHVSGTIRGVAAVYNRFDYLDERCAALEDWGHYVSKLSSSSPMSAVKPRS